MILFINFFIIFFVLSELVFNDFFAINDDFSIHNLFIWYFLFIIFLNYKKNNEKTFLKFDLDLIFKFLVILLKTPNFLINYITNTIKKIFLYLLHFKFRYLKNSILIFFKKYLNNFFITWRPLFKKTSYFGYYRSNRSKWIK